MSKLATVLVAAVLLSAGIASAASIAGHYTIADQVTMDVGGTLGIRLAGNNGSVADNTVLTSIEQGTFFLGRFTVIRP